ncbi:MAG: hypothetical protein M1817_005229 [Caeruleum heppii]|nr:MAG: hypothetical protein M1817_005229 [Caeruleum heppii]
MFKKKPNIKPLAPIRSSDRRKLADQIIKDFNVKVPEGIEEPNGKQQEEGQTSSPGPTLSSIRNALLPEHSMSAKFTTTAGPDLKTVSGTVYIGSHPCKAQRVLWIKYYERMYPTGCDM